MMSPRQRIRLPSLRVGGNSLGVFDDLAGRECRCPNRGPINDAGNSLGYNGVKMGEMVRHDFEVIPAGVIVG